MEGQQLVNDIDVVVSGWPTIMQQGAFTAHTGIGSSMWGRFWLLQNLAAGKMKDSKPSHRVPS
jgi:hypothetical protein